mmetsp:Transcript_5634/g.15772  ORF Transcript_5634/g.15772 Transcript_5634/m.15772 type:complete len:235 (+) Transcript_5634:732-1436(+)
MESDMISVMGSSDEDLGMNFSGFSMEPMSGTRCSGPTSEVWGEVGSKNATGKRLTDVAEPTLSTSRPDLLIVPEIQELVGCQLPYATPQSRRSSTGSPTGMFPSLPAYSADFKPGTSVQFGETSLGTPRVNAVHESNCAVPRGHGSVTKRHGSVTKHSSANQQRIRQVGAAINPRKRTTLPCNASKQGWVQTCLSCGTTSTPLWRGGPDGPKTLCNACGVRYMKSNKRPRDKRV